MAKAASKTVAEPEATVFDGKTLPPGADESWWGAPANPDNPKDGLRVLQVPGTPAYLAAGDGPSTVNKARPGATITRYPGVNEAYDRWEVSGGTGLPPDDQAVTGPDMQMPYLHDAHAKAHSLEPEPTPQEVRAEALFENRKELGNLARAQLEGPNDRNTTETAAQRRRREADEAKN